MHRQPNQSDRSPSPKEAGVVVTCDAGGLAADLAAVDSLCRVALATRQAGWRLRISGASPELAGLLDSCGLANVLPCEGNVVEAPLVHRGRQAEEREQPVGVEERDLVDDAPA